MSTARAFEPSDGPDDAPALQQVHEPPGPGEADPQLALQHGGGAEPAAHHQLHRLAEQVVAVVVGRRRTDCRRPPAGSSPAMPST